jgi:hypothetical protein
MNPAEGGLVEKMMLFCRVSRSSSPLHNEVKVKKPALVAEHKFVTGKWRLFTLLAEWIIGVCLLLVE